MHPAIAATDASTDQLVTDPSGFGWRAVFDPPVNLYLWPRPAVLSGMLETWIPRAPVNVDLEIASSGVARRGLSEALAHWPGVESLECTDWVADMALLAERYRALVNRAPVRLRLETVTDEDRAVFDVGRFSVRLICTYAGSGVQWLPDSMVNRAELGFEGRSPAAANRAIGPTAAIREIPAGTVALLRGEGEPGRAGRGIVYRLHPVRTRKWRVRFSLDVAGQP